MRMKINKAKATFTERSLRRDIHPATTARYPEGTKQDFGKDTRAAKGREGNTKVLK
jgi:hypothetical protein